MNRRANAAKTSKQEQRSCETAQWLGYETLGVFDAGIFVGAEFAKSGSVMNAEAIGGVLNSRIGLAAAGGVGFMRRYMNSRKRILLADGFNKSTAFSISESLLSLWKQKKYLFRDGTGCD